MKYKIEHNKAERVVNVTVSEREIELWKKDNYHIGFMLEAIAVTVCKEKAKDSAMYHANLRRAKYFRRKHGIGIKLKQQGT